ncbi:MAG: TlpA family protein disulfide reductase [Flavobacteriaceae bacterium]
MNNFFYIFCLVISLGLNAQNPLPDVNLKTLMGKTISTTEISNNNKLMVISLWATWCVPCKNELDAIAEVYEDWVDDTGVSLFAVSIDDSRTSKRIKPMINGKDWEFEILLDENSDLKRAFGVSTVPFTVLIKNGKIVYKHTGYTPGYENELYDQILKFTD